MKLIFDGFEEMYDVDVRLVKNLSKMEVPKEFPEMFKWALQMLYFNGSEWIELCRIDNYPHESQYGCHIHVYKVRKVKRIDVSFHDAEKVIKEVSKRLLKERFKRIIEFE
ncbi:MAG: DUF6516 family protein [Candidatus Woesearchaeota archaeon]